MKFIKRIPISAGMITDEQDQQTDLWYTNEAGALVAVDPWVPSSSVATGDRRSHAGKVWQALSNHSGNIDPEIDPIHWQFVAPTNRWAAFDDAVGSAIQETGSLSFKLTPGKKFDSFGVLGMEGSSLTAEIRVPDLPTFSGFSINGTHSVGSEFTGIAKGNGVYVAVAAKSNAISSTDGSSWTVSTLPGGINPTWSGVAFGNGVFVAVSGSQYSTIAATSTDGITWTQRTLPIDGGWSGVFFGAGLFVTFDLFNYRAATSTDGINWTLRTMPDILFLSHCVYGNGIFVATASAGSEGAYATSTDGITWTKRTLTGIGGPICFGNGTFLVQIGSTISRSVDGINWTAGIYPFDGYGLIRDIEFGAGVFVATGKSNNVWAFSSDGVLWTKGFSDVPQVFLFGDDKFIGARNTNSLSATYSTTTPIYSTTIPLIEDEEPVIDYWTWCFAGFKQKDSLIVTNLASASYTNASIKIAISGALATDPVKLGVFTFGQSQDAGRMKRGMVVSGKNYSTYETDKFGTTRVTPRGFAKKVEGSLVVPVEQFNGLLSTLIEYKDVPMLFFPTDRQELSGATLFGHLNDWKLSIDYDKYILLPIVIHGLT